MQTRRAWEILAVAGGVLAAAMLTWRVTAGRFPWQRASAPRSPASPTGHRPAGRPTGDSPDPTGPGPAVRSPTPHRSASPRRTGPAARLLARLAGLRHRPLDAVARRLEDWTDGIAQSPTYYRLLGKLALDAGQPAQAERHFQRACELAPDAPTGYVGLALVEVRRRRFDPAKELFEKALSLDPWHVDALYNLAVLHSRRHQLHDAERLYRKVLTTQPDHFRSQFNLATIATYYGRLGQALSLWERVVAARPGLVDAHYNLGLICLQLKRYDQAITHFEAVRTKQPRDADVWNNLGLAYQGKGDDAQTLIHYQRAYQLAPRTAEGVLILNNLADFHLTLHNRNASETKHLKEAMLLWRQSLAIKSDQPRLKDLLRYFSYKATTQPDKPSGR